MEIAFQIFGYFVLFLEVASDPPFRRVKSVGQKYFLLLSHALNFFIIFKSIILIQTVG
jgi:hypothetical protein